MLKTKVEIINAILYLKPKYPKRKLWAKKFLELERVLKKLKEKYVE